MRSVALRRGATLAELLVALTLATLVAAVALAVLRRQLRTTSELVERSIAEAATTDVWHLLASELGAAHGVADSSLGLIAAGDSLLELWAARGFAVVCDADASRLTVVAPGAADSRAADWVATPRLGDRVVAVQGASLDHPATDRWAVRDLIDDPEPAPCPAPPRSARAPGVRWRVAGGPASIGAAVRVLRRTQYRLHRSSDGAWTLGQREWNGATWSATQPAIAPLLPAARAMPGLALVAEDAQGHRLPRELPTGTPVRAVRVVVRGGRARGALVDSIVTVLRVGAP